MGPLHYRWAASQETLRAMFQTQFLNPLPTAVRVVHLGLQQLSNAKFFANKYFFQRQLNRDVEDLSGLGRIKHTVSNATEMFVGEEQT